MAFNAGTIVASLDLDTGQFSAKLEKAKKQSDGFVGKLKGYGEAFEDLGKGLTLGVTAPVAGLGAAAAKSAIDFESAFAGVKKTVDATDKQLGELETGIRDMAKEIPASATAIAEVAEAAGQLGIETDNILSFTRVMVDLGEATNLSSDEAATSLARLANITGMSQQDFDRLGSTIVDLGNNLATTESEIVAMGLRLAGAGSQIGLTEAQIMSFAGALSSVGIEAEAGGSAFSKVMIEMQLAVETGLEGYKTFEESVNKAGYSMADVTNIMRTGGKGVESLAKSLGIGSKELKSLYKDITESKGNLDSFANVAGMTGEEFRKAFQEDAAGAIIAFIQGLGNVEERGMSAIAVLEEMDITEVRLRDTLLRASGASDVFAESIEIGTKAWEENNALTKEAEQRYKTTASQIEIAKNYLKDAGITVGEIVVPHIVSLAEKVKEVSTWFSNLNPKTQESIVKMGGLVAAIGPVLFIGGKLTGGIGSVIGLFNKFGAGAKVATTAASALSGASGLGSVVATGTKAGGVIASLGGAAGTGGALGGLTTSIGASLAAINPWVLGIGAAAVAGVTLSKYLKEETIPALEEFDESISESTRQAVTNFLDIEKQAITSLNQLAWSGMEVTEEMKDSITANTNQMADEVIAKLEEQKEEALKHLKEMFDKSTDMNEEEKKEAIRIATEKYDEQIKKVQEGKIRIEEILTEAAENNRKITNEERIEIEEIIEDLKDNSIKLMSESQEEQEKILENLKNNATRLTAEMLADVVKNSIEQKEKTIAEANKQYEEVKAAMELLKKDGTEESRELADNMIAEAERQKDESIAAAEEMHQKVLQEVTNQGGDLVNQIDLDNGKIKTKWDELRDWFNRNPIVRWIKTVFEDDPKARELEKRDRLNPVNLASDKNSRQWGNNMADMFAEGINERMPVVENAVNGIAKTTEDYLGFNSPTEKGPGSTADKWMPNMVQMFADGINNNAHKVKNASDELANKIRDSMDQVSGYISKTVSIIEKEFKLWQTRNENLKGSSKELELQLEMQKQKQNLLTEELRVAEKAMADITAKYGEGSSAALEYKEKVLDLQIQHSNLTNEINKSAEAMRNLILQNNKKAFATEMERARAQSVIDEYTERRKYDTEEEYDEWNSPVWYEIGGKSVPGNSKSGFREVLEEAMGRLGDKFENSEVGKILTRSDAFDKYDISKEEYEELRKKHNIGNNAHGTNYWGGGWTWVGEQGPEIVELPPASKVYSNQKSMEMVKGASGGITQSITINSPTPLSPSEIARKNLQVSRQLAMEWGL